MRASKIVVFLKMEQKQPKGDQPKEGRETRQGSLWKRCSNQSCWVCLFLFSSYFLLIFFRFVFFFFPFFRVPSWYFWVLKGSRKGNSPCGKDELLPPRSALNFGPRELGAWSSKRHAALNMGALKRPREEKEEEEEKTKTKKEKKKRIKTKKYFMDRKKTSARSYFDWGLGGGKTRAHGDVCEAVKP